MLLLLSTVARSQSSRGEVQIEVKDPAGLPVGCTVEIFSEGNQVRRSVITDSNGQLTERNLPFGSYLVRVQSAGFVLHSQKIEVNQRAPLHLDIRLAVEAAASKVLVTDADTLVNAEATGTINRLGITTLEKKSAALPGRSVVDLVSAQPGWVLESNGSLHPRGSEYQVQYVVDGIPLTENRSPAFSPGMGADDLDSITVLTSAFPAEYGRKLGGVVELQSKSIDPGLHGDFVASGGSFATVGTYGDLGYAHGRNSAFASADFETTARYLDPPVLQNYSNHGSIKRGQIRYEREVTNRDRLAFSLREEQANFEVPDELLQALAGQKQSRNETETDGTISYEHIVSPNAVADARLMFRNVSASLSSNLNSTPIVVNQQRGFREAYGKVSYSLHRGIQNLKAGMEVDYSPLRERFQSTITDYSFFPPEIPSRFAFAGHEAERDQAAFIEDALHVRDWSLSAGLRYDHYDLLLNRSGLSPRIGVARYWKRADLNLHASYDRAFQTPASENILLSSSPAVQALSPQVLRIPVPPSAGNYWDVGASKGLFSSLKIDVDWYRRSFRDYADDDLLLNTGVSFPIAFRKGNIYGADTKLQLPQWKRFSGFLSYSYVGGFGYAPVTGGLFLGSDVALLHAVSRFPVTQDQRNTVHGRGIVQITKRFWSAMGAAYGSGLPTEFSGTLQDALRQYGTDIVDRVDFGRGRVRPDLAIDASVGLELFQRDTTRLRLQADAQNLNNRVNVINFAGLFSGTGVAPPRSYAIRLQASF